MAKPPLKVGDRVQYVGEFAKDYPVDVNFRIVTEVRHAEGPSRWHFRSRMQNGNGEVWNIWNDHDWKVLTPEEFNAAYHGRPFTEQEESLMAKKQFICEVEYMLTEKVLYGAMNEVAEVVAIAFKKPPLRGDKVVVHYTVRAEPGGREFVVRDCSLKPFPDLCVNDIIIYHDEHRTDLAVVVRFEMVLGKSYLTARVLWSTHAEPGTTFDMAVSNKHFTVIQALEYFPEDEYSD